MRIGIEAQRIFRKNKHGMDYVVLQEIKELQKIDKNNEYFVFVAPGEDVCLEDTKNFHIIEMGGSFYPVWEQITLYQQYGSHTLCDSINSDTPRHYLSGAEGQKQQIALPEHGLVLP